MNYIIHQIIIRVLQPDLTHNMSHSQEKLDMNLLKNSFVGVYKTEFKLNTDLNWYKENGYAVINLDAEKWNNELDFHSEISKQMGFPDYYGNNLNALNDCLFDALKDKKTNLVIVLHNYELAIQRIGERFAWSVLDIFADKSRMLALEGIKIVTLVRSTNEIEMEAVGGKPLLIIEK